MNMYRYALCVACLPILFLAGIAFTNKWVDPYQIFTADRVAIYRHKPALHANMRLHKAFQVKLQKPDALILGSSKAIQGIPTEHPIFKNHRVYNLAMPLASMKELTYLLRHANEVEPIRAVVLALDFLSFNTLARNDGPAAGFQRERLLGNEQSGSLPIRDYFSALITMDAFLASAEVMKARYGVGSDGLAQVGSSHRVLTGLGGRLDEEIRSRLNDGGHRSNTVKIEEFFTNAVYLPAPQHLFSFQNGEHNSLYWFEQFLRTLHRNRISASLFVSPSHARLNELIDAAGLWPEFEQWKRQMLSVSVKVAAEFDDAPYVLFDFSTPGDITTEPFPEAGDSRHKMRYYYESIHFNQYTGKLVLDYLLDSQTGFQKTAELTPFGRPLSTENIEAVLSDIREKQWLFRQQFPDHRAELEKIVADR